MHRLPMARAARNAGFEVHVATRINRDGAAIKAEGFVLHALSWQRGSLDPRRIFRVVRELRGLYHSTSPNIVHHVSLQAALVGSLAALGLSVTCLNAITGLGSISVDDSVKLRAMRRVLGGLCRMLFNRPRSAVLVENPDDRAALVRLGVAPGRITLIRGSGVDIDAMKPAPEPAGTVTSVFVGRLLEAKGIRTLLAAHEILCQRGRDVRLLIAGLPDPANPTSILASEIEAWGRRPNFTYLGFVKDIARLWATANIAVLPSRGGEGVPVSLLEAAACGRPLVATDVPGCREIARQDVNALLVPPDNPEALANAIDQLAADPKRRRRFGKASRQIAEMEFSHERVGRDIVMLYWHLLERIGPADRSHSMRDADEALNRLES
jgi:glycosyltransferase involved in cell wall biosynthesis